MTPLPADAPPTRPIWLTTLADLSLLLVGFFVFLQANQMDRTMLAASLRAGFGVAADTSAPMAVEMAVVSGFAAGAASGVDYDAAIDWARAAARDPRTRITIIGEADGSPGDVDPKTRSAAILSTDRARGVAERLVAARAIAPDRIQIATATGKRRVTLTIGFDGARR